MCVFSDAPLQLQSRRDALAEAAAALLAAQEQLHRAKVVECELRRQHAAALRNARKKHERLAALELVIGAASKQAGRNVRLLGALGSYLQEAR